MRRAAGGEHLVPAPFLATVRQADGTPLPAEQRFVTDFTSLQTTGDYPKR